MEFTREDFIQAKKGRCSPKLVKNNIAYKYVHLPQPRYITNMKKNKLEEKKTSTMCKDRFWKQSIKNINF